MLIPTPSVAPAAQTGAAVSPALHTWQLLNVAPNGTVTKRFRIPGAWIYTFSIPLAFWPWFWVEMLEVRD